ncbi:MAG: hypothetical protein QM536_01120 [Chitinophagaceae bacterium]|nr:hypothetical protein [Chitinophagaceae bacterium]
MNQKHKTQIKKNIVWILLLLFSSCNKNITNIKITDQSNISSPSKKKYSEDLSIYRNKKYREIIDEEPTENDNPYPITPIPEHSINQELDTLRQILIEKNGGKDYIEGFTIQVYSGINRKLAEEALAYAKIIDLEEPPQLVYVQPNYKVKVGFFYSRMQSYPTHKKVLKRFPTALLLPEKQKINTP